MHVCIHRVNNLLSPSFLSSPHWWHIDHHDHHQSPNQTKPQRNCTNANHLHTLTRPTSLNQKTKTKKLNTYLSRPPNQALPNPRPQPQLDQTRKNHQIPRLAHQLVPHRFSGLALEASLFAIREEQVALFADAGDCPEEKRTDEAGDGRGKGGERLGVRADDGDGGGGV